MDADAATEGVDHYNVFVRLNGMPGTDTLVDKYQTVSTAGTHDIDLSTLTNGGLVPADGDSVILTVVAVDAANNASTPSVNDTTMITWDKVAPSIPTGLNLEDVPGYTDMHVWWDSGASDPDLLRYDYYVNFNAPATPTQFDYYQSIPKTFYDGYLNIGAGNDLEHVQEGDEVYVSLYAVDKFGNKSLAAEAHATYSTAN